MPKYVIKQSESDSQESQVESELVKLVQEENGDVTLMAGGWCVFGLNTNGKGELVESIAEDNDAGLIVDKEGRIVLED